MTLYRKKGTMEAVQWWKPGDDDRIRWVVREERYAIRDPDLSTWLEIHPGDWIVTENGRHTVVDNETFQEEYEEIPHDPT